MLAEIGGGRRTRAGVLAILNGTPSARKGPADGWSIVCTIARASAKRSASACATVRTPPHGTPTARNREIHASAVSPASASSTRRPVSSRLPTRALLMSKRGPIAHSGWAIAAAKRPKWASLATARATVPARVG